MNTLSTIVLSAGLVLLSGLGVGCASGGGSRTEPAPARPTGEWVATAIDGEAITAERPPTITFMPEGRVAGFAGVNRFSGGLVEGPEFRFAPMAVTRMAGPPEAMALEGSFLAALDRVRGFRMSGDELNLTGEEPGKGIMLRRGR